MSEVKVRKPRAAKVPAVAPEAAPAPPTNDIRITNKVFADALARAAPMIARTATVPILKCVALTAGDGRLTIESSNLEQALRQSVPITGMGAGGGCVDQERLAAVVKRLPPDAETILEFSEASLLVRCGASRVTFSLWPLADFPVFAVRDDTRAAFVMAAPALGAMLDRVIWAMSDEQTRFYLCGVCVGPHGEGDAARLRAAATNGNDLAVASATLAEGADVMPTIIIPTPAVTELAKLLKGAATVDLTVSETVLVAAFGDVVLLTKLIGATYPNYDRVIPAATSRRFAVDGPALIRIVELASLFSRSDRDRVKPWVRLTLSENRCVVFAGGGTDQVVSELDPGAFSYAGEDITITVTAFCLLETAERARGRVVFHLNPDAPFLIEDSDDSDVRYVSGPIRA
jgi:DNA polymerase-3 subunit beta